MSLITTGSVATNPTGGYLSRLSRHESAPLAVALVAFFLLFGFYEPRFFRSYNLINILRNSSFLVIISLGQMLTLILGGFDLSVGAVVALASITSALTMVGLAPVMPEQVFLVVALGVLAGLAAGGLVGLVNGLCVSLLEVPPFIVTMGTMSIATGLALYITTGLPVYGMPEEFSQWLGRFKMLGLPIPIYITAGITGFVWWLMSWTTLGRYIYAIGGNPHAARVSGIRVAMNTTIAYSMCGLLAALTGILLTARIGTGEGTMGGEFIMQSIAAAVIGGASIGGGIGRVELVTVGAVFLTIVTNGMNLVKVDSKMQTIVVGAILIATMTFDQFRHRRRDDYRP